MSQYTTDEILAKLEAWYAKQRQKDPAFPWHSSLRFWSFDGLVGADLSGIDLSRKQWYSHSGQYEHAGEFHKREMMMRQKNMWRKHSFLEWLALWLLGVSSGYGERPSWVLGWTLACWLGFALLYWLGGALQGQVLPAGPFMAALYYSATAITTFGPPILSSKWGVVAAAPWAMTVAQIQGVLAYFLLALFLVTFVQKASRS
jgi:hypothetical protein